MTADTKNKNTQAYNSVSSKWRYFFAGLGIVQVLIVLIFLLVFAWGVRQAKNGVSGFEFIGLALLVVSVPVTSIIAIINLIGLPIYLIRHKPKRTFLLLSVMSLIISAVVVLYGLYSFYQIFVAIPKQTNKITEQLRKENEELDTAVNTNQAKTKEQAVSFMQACKADYFMGYTDIALISDKNTRSWLEKAEKSSTGIEIYEASPYSYVFASKAMTSTLQDAARQYRQSCYNTKKLYLTIDNWTEAEYPAGQWTKVKL